MLSKIKCSDSMSLEQLKSFLSKVKVDSSLQEKLKAAGDVHAVVAIAKEHGHVFSVDQFSLISDNELEALSGSAPCWLTDSKIANEQHD